MKRYIKASDSPVGVDWSYFRKFEPFNRQYLPDRGEGDTLATQAATAVTKLVYKWYNDGDVYDNQHGMQGWANDLSTYANWLLAHVGGAGRILSKIYNCHSDEDYEHILKDLADFVYDENKLAQLNEMPAEGSVYEEDGPFVFKDYDDDDDEEYWEEEGDEEEEYEDYEFEEDKE